MIMMFPNLRWGQIISNADAQCPCEVCGHTIQECEDNECECCGTQLEYEHGPHLVTKS